MVKHIKITPTTMFRSRRRRQVKSKDDTKEETNCGEDTGLTEAHCRVRVLGMREKREGSPFAGILQFWECSTG